VAGIATGCAARTPASDRATSPATLAVVTWNTHAGAGDLQRLVNDLSTGRLTGTPPADYVLLLQEIINGGPQLPAGLAQNRPLHFMFEPIRVRGARTSGNAILSTLPLTDERQIALPRERQPRGALLVTVAVAGQPLFLVDAHLENRVGITRGLLFSDGPRDRQARALVDLLPAGHGILGGDLNTWLGPDEPALKTLAARFPETPTDRIRPTVRDRLVLDHLFFDLPDGWTASRWSLRDYYGSDHRPVVGVISASAPHPGG
jgi:endonuclease/exonuclease/phosphatase family metal-dependent hydrolase